MQINSFKICVDNIFWLLKNGGGMLSYIESNASVLQHFGLSGSVTIAHKNIREREKCNNRR